MDDNPTTTSRDIRMSNHLQAQNSQFQNEIAMMDPAETDDPLDVYFRYIQWLFEVFPQATGHQEVIKLVEKPLRLFRDDERYRNDARYVKMWIWYTGLINEGQEAVFQFLLSNNIGDSLAVLYEEYAKLLEGREKTRKADEVYQLGVARKAQPLARLERKYVDFQRRVMARTIRAVDMAAAANGPVSNGGGGGGQVAEQMGGSHRTTTRDENQDTFGRTMLGAKRSGRSVNSAAANTLPPSQRGLSGNSAAAGSSIVSRPNARISVFADTDEPTTASAPPSAPASAAVGQRRGERGALVATPWLDIGSDEGRRKENMLEASSWRGQTLEQRRTPAAAGRPVVEKFTVFSDEPKVGDGDSDAHGETPAAAVAASISTLNPSSNISGVLGQRQVDGKALTSSSGLLNSFDASTAIAATVETSSVASRPPGKSKPLERMVMSDGILFPSGDGVPQCVEEARSRLPRYAFDYHQWQLQHERPEPAPILENTVDSGIRRSKRKSLGVSSPTINTKVAQKEMLGIWNDDLDSDSDSESLRDVNTPCKTPLAGGSKRSAAITDDDYQFTMGPVTPHVVPESIGRQLPVIPTSARSFRFASGLGRPDVDENDAPTVVLNSIRAARRQELQMTRARPTPLAARLHPTPLASRGYSTPLASRGQQSILLQPMMQRMGHLDESDEEAVADAEAGTPANKKRIQIFRDPESIGNGINSNTRPESPSVISLGRFFDDSRGVHSAPADMPSQTFDDAVAGSADRLGPLYSTPIRSARAPGTRGATHSIPHSASAAMRYSQHTPGYTRTATGYSISGAEFSAVSGFTGVSTIGWPTSSMPNDQFDSGDEERRSEVSQTPMRKRLSMAARDLGRITPRFPSEMAGNSNNAEHDVACDYAEEEEDDEDDVDEDEDDGDEPCTENIGEFSDLDSQMNELQMQLGAQYMPHVPASVERPSGRDSGSRTSSEDKGSMFQIFRD
ncbi:protein kinase [Kickxella alabastrina]|nr:protein kinase [Kickxella alabastrina]